MQETWYVLEDGTSADPNEVAPDDTGALVHRSGLAVAMRGQVPHTRGVDLEAEKVKRPAKAKEVKPAEPKRGYKTRESKAE